MKFSEVTTADEIYAYLLSLPDNKIRRALSTMWDEIILSDEESFRLFQLLFSDPRYFTSQGVSGLLFHFLYGKYTKEQREFVTRTLFQHIEDINADFGLSMGRFLVEEYTYQEALDLMYQLVNKNTPNALDVAYWGIKGLIEKCQSDAYYEDNLPVLHKFYQRVVSCRAKIQSS